MSRNSGPELKVALFDHPAFLEHESGPGHPERPERLLAFRRGLAEAGLESRFEKIEPGPAPREGLLRVHSESHVSRIERSQGQSVRFDPDTLAGPGSYDAAVRAAGAVLEAVDGVLDGRFDRAICAVRPPGHHAERDRPMGFCLFNNLAIGAARALDRGLDRVAVIDWDVHHGNGTQHSFEQDPRLLFVSSHAWPFYPGTGALQEQGRDAGLGFTVNLPLPQGCGDAEYMALYRQVVEPIGTAFDPQLVLVSMGFDPHFDDPLAGMRVTTRGFAELARVCLAIARVAARRRVVFVLEGGYDEDGIAASAAAVARIALGDAGPEAPAESPAAGFLPVLSTLRRAHAAHWAVLS